MISRIRKMIDDREAGFTLIELLVVIIIIGILAAIAIPTFLNQRTKGWDAASKSTLRNAATAEESYYTDNSAYAPALTDLTGQGFNTSAGTTLTVVSAGTATAYCLKAKSGQGANYYMTNTSGQPTTTVCT